MLEKPHDYIENVSVSAEESFQRRNVTVAFAESHRQWVKVALAQGLRWIEEGGRPHASAYN